MTVEGVIAIGLLGAVAFAAIFGERRRWQAVEANRADSMSPAEEPDGAAAEPDEDPSAGWEVDAADETVATIDYEAPGDLVEPAGEPVDEPPDEAHD